MYIVAYYSAFCNKFFLCVGFGYTGHHEDSRLYSVRYEETA
jgi:hypothetical protein